MNIITLERKVAMRRSILPAMIPVLLLAATFTGCGDDESALPTEGEALKKHLLNLVLERHEATVAGNVDKSRSYLLPYMRDEQRATAIWVGEDPEPDMFSDSTRAIRKERGPEFKEGKPIKLETHGRWARLTQDQTDYRGERRTVRGYFLRDDGRWWIVGVIDSPRGGFRDPDMAHAEAETYWPGNIEAYFFLPQVDLKLELVGKASSAWEDFRVQASVTNVSSHTISKLQTRRWFTTVSYILGDSSTARAPRGKGVDPGYGPLPPGETLVLGAWDIAYPAREPQKGMVWKESRYLSNRLILPVPTD